jgi:hypothetical protein
MKKMFGKKQRFSNGTKIGAVVFAVALVTMATINSGSIKNLHGEELLSFGREASQIEPAAGPEEMMEPVNAPEGDVMDGEPGVSEGWGGPAFGDDSDDDVYEGEIPVEELTTCGSYPDWIGQEVDEEAIKETGKPYRILKPDSMATMDHSPDRINVMVDENNIVVEVRCG